MEEAAGEQREVVEERRTSSKSLAYAKLKEVSRMALPMVPVGMSQYLLRVVSMAMVGHLGAVALSGVALATSLASVTGFSLLIGLASALETLCGQAYGAGQYKKIASYTYSSIISLLIFCVPVSLLWVFMDKLLILVHQDPQISDVARRYCVWLIPSLFGYAIFQSLLRYFQSQGIFFPLFTSTLVALCIHVPVCWVLVYKLGLGIKGAALSIGIAYWLYTIFLWLFMRYSRSCEKTRDFVPKDLFSSAKEFLRLAVPSALMLCLEWWSLEIVILLSGILPNSKVETSILSMCFLAANLHYYIVNALGAAASTQVSNELGAGNAQSARAAAFVSIALVGVESVLVGIALYFCRNIWGRVFSNDKDILDYSSEITPLLSIYIIVDSFLAVLCGIARGTGWQRFGAYINIAAYYLVGVPIGAVLCFIGHLRGKGLLVGVMIGSLLQAVVLSLMVCFTHWDKEAVRTRERILKGTSPPLQDESAV